MEKDPEVAAHEARINEVIDLRNQLRIAVNQLRLTEDTMFESLRKATETGYEMGWVAGVLDSADLLDEKGFVRNAKEVRSLVEGNLLALPSIGDA